MAELPSVTGQEAIRVFERFGFEVIRVKSSHHILKKPDHPFLLAIPVHGSKDLKKGTLKRLIRDSGATVEEFVALLRE